MGTLKHLIKKLFMTIMKGSNISNFPEVELIMST